MPSDTIITNDIQEALKLFVIAMKQNEEECLSVFEHIISTYRDIWHSYCNINFVITVREGKKTFMTPLAKAIDLSYISLAKKLILSGVSLDGSSTSDIQKQNGANALYYACIKDDIEAATLLIEEGIYLLHQKADGASILASIISHEIMDKVLTAARKQGVLNQLLVLKNYRRQTIIEIYRKHPQGDILCKIFLINMLNQLFDVEKEKDENAFNQLLESIHKFFNLSFIHQHCADLYDILFFRALARNSLNAVKIYLQHGLDILIRSPDGGSCLHAISTLEACQLLLEHAKSQDKLYDLIKIHSNSGDPIYAIACNYNLIPVLEELRKIKDYKYYIDLEHLLHAAKKAYEVYPEQRAYYDELSKEIQPLVRKVKLIPPVTELQLNLGTAYYELFRNEIWEVPSLPSKQDALKIALAKFYTVLNNPTLCYPYLIDLDNKLKDYFKDKHKHPFPVLKPNYQFVKINGLYFPIPNADYSGIDKKSALQELLFMILQEAGVSFAAHKLIGYLPKNISKEIFQRGDFITESRLGEGLCHGKIIHMIQFYFLKCMYDNLEFGSLDYVENTVIKTLHFPDIIAGFMNTYLTSKEKCLAWSEILDGAVTFPHGYSHPHTLHTDVMHLGHSLSFPNLANYLIDTFIKGFQQQLIARKMVDDLSFTPMEYANHLDQMLLHNFQVSEDIIEYDIKREEEKRSNYEKKDQHALIHKKYAYNPHFVPQKYCNPYSQTQKAFLETSCVNYKFNKIIYLRSKVSEASLIEHAQSMIDTFGPKVFRVHPLPLTEDIANVGMVKISLLHYAIVYSPMLAELLLINNANIDSQSKVNCNQLQDLKFECLTPLMFAAIFNKPEGIKLLLKYKPDLLLINQNGDNALSLAKDRVACELIIDAAIEQGCLPQVLSQSARGDIFPTQALSSVLGEDAKDYLLSIEILALTQVLTQTDDEVLNYLAKLTQRLSKQSIQKIRIKQSEGEESYPLVEVLQKIGLQLSENFIKTKYTITPSLALGLFAVQTIPPAPPVMSDITKHVEELCCDNNEVFEAIKMRRVM